MLIHFCFLEGPKRPTEYTPEGIRPSISVDVDELGISPNQALAVCEELNNHKTIAAWLTSVSRISLLQNSIENAKEEAQEAEAEMERIYNAE